MDGLRKEALVTDRSVPREGLDSPKGIIIIIILLPLERVLGQVTDNYILKCESHGSETPCDSYKLFTRKRVRPPFCIYRGLGRNSL